jgi:OPA family glycerol-3-phosphate transporter-like MFS transporter/OPA family sugar phosphate sensor protein UhpC-like MFS transporter
MAFPFDLLKPAAASSRVTDPKEVERQYRYWRPRILIATIIGYALFYFVRKNLSIAMPAMEESLHISKKQLGMFLTMHGLLYGVSKFANGVLGDRANARWFLVLGLIISAAINVLFGLSSAVIAFGLFWMLNGWFQGMGFPPCARLMTHWFPPKELATKMSIWNISHSLGAGLVFVLCGYLVGWSWRLCFLVPAGIVLVGAAYLALTLRDTPESLGLPEVEGTATTALPNGESETHGQVLRKMVFANPYIWILSLANFFVYTVRYGILDWGPTFLKQAKHMELSHAGWMVAAFEVTGILGMVASGWLTDHVFGGRGVRTSLVYMILCTLSLFVFWLLPVQSVAVNTALLCLSGFFIYGPQCLVGIVASNWATKRAAATAVGLTGLFGYASSLLSGVGIGILVDKYGWDAGFLMFVVAAIIGAILFAICWPARATGYQQEN